MSRTGVINTIISNYKTLFPLGSIFVGCYWLYWGWGRTFQIEFHYQVTSWMSYALIG